MAGVVHIPFYATVFRGDKLEAALAELAPVTARYGASWYAVHRNRDDAYKILFMAQFEDKADWDAFWNGPEASFFRGASSGYYQVPLVYTWNDVVVDSHVGATHGGAAQAVGDVA